MSAPFHFPSAYGKLGNWPGSLGPHQAQALFMEAVAQKKDAKFVELGFDGGRTTIVLSWAAREMQDLKIFVAPVLNDETGLWFRRAQILHKMDLERVTGHEGLEPFPADLIVLDPSVPPTWPVVADWIRLAPHGASVVSIGNGDFAQSNLKEHVKAPGITIWHKVAEPGNVINRAIETVANGFITDKANLPVDKNLRAKVRSLRRSDERPRNTDGTDTELHAPVDADQGNKLLSS